MSARERFVGAWNARLHPERQEQIAQPNPADSRLPKTERKILAAPSYVGWQGVPRTLYGGGDVYDYFESRRISLTPTPRVCIHRLKLDVMNTSWEIVPLTKEGAEKPDDTAMAHAREIV